MRYINYDELKDDIHSQGLTIEMVAAYMHISPSTFRYRFCKGEIDKDQIEHLNWCIREALKDKRRYGL